MRLSVYKNNKFLEEIDLSQESFIDSHDDFIQFYIGRASDCHVILDDHQVSREHAKLTNRGEAWEIQKSSNFGDLHLNGMESSFGKLKNGDIISIPPFTINVNIEGSETFEANGAGHKIEQSSQEQASVENEIEEDPAETRTMYQSESQDLLEETVAIGPDLEFTDLLEDKNNEALDALSDESNDEAESSEDDLELDIEAADAIPEEPEENKDEDLDDVKNENGMQELDLGIENENGETEVFNSLEDEDLEENNDKAEQSADDESLNEFETSFGASEEADSLGDSSGEFDENMQYDSHGPSDQESNDVESEFSNDNNDELNFESNEDQFSNNFDDDNDEGSEFIDEEEKSEDFNLSVMGDGDDATQVFSGFANFELQLYGEHAPYDRYTIRKDEIVIGRDPNKCDIVLNDPDVSSVHCRLSKNKITLMLKDEGSANGTILNGQRINQSEIADKDEFLIGATSFTVRVISDLLKEEQGRLMPVDMNQVVEVEEVVEEEVDFGDEAFEGETPQSTEEKKGLNAILKDPEKRKKILIYAVVILGLWVVLDEDPKKTTKVAKQPSKNEKSRLLENEKKVDVVKDQKTTIPSTARKTREYSDEEKEILERQYLLGREHMEIGDYENAIISFEKIFSFTGGFDYKKTEVLLEAAKQALRDIEEEEQKIQAKKEREIRKEKVKELLVRAKEAVKNREVEVAESLFSAIFELDPENFDVPLLKEEISAYKKQKEEEEVAAAQKEAERKRKLALLQPGKTLYLKKDWYKAIFELEEFLRVSDMDEDLIKEGTTMLEEAREELSSQTGPLLSKARSLRDGQDLKGAYETYKEVLRYDPANEESLSEMNAIKNTLVDRARSIYREALVSESLSLFNDAKEKYQEVQQISPIDSDYYRKATVKLKQYAE